MNSSTWSPSACRPSNVQLYEEARAAQRQDDWATYGEKIQQLGEVISALRALEN
jgi:uncharacterized membrane protein (UPF0182 family)